MKAHEMLGYPSPNKKNPNGLNELIGAVGIWISNEEAELLNRVRKPIKLKNLSEHDQFRIQSLIRKSLVTKVGTENPTVVANEKPF